MRRIKKYGVVDVITKGRIERLRPSIRVTGRLRLGAFRRAAWQIAFGVLLASFAALTTADTVLVFGPKTYERGKGKPVAVVDRFSAAESDTGCEMWVDNGHRPDGHSDESSEDSQEPGDDDHDSEPSARVSSASISLNGERIFRPRDFNQQVTSLHKPVTLQVDNRLRVKINSAPGSQLTIEIRCETPGNTVPVADAGPDQTVQVGDTVHLDGSGSTDADGDSLTFAWSWIGQPAGSGAVLSDTTAVQPSFVVDVAGRYTLQLVVSDGSKSSAPDAVVIDTVNSPPVADAGPDQTVLVGETVTLTGAGSSDVDGDVLSFAWTLTGVPPGSTASLDDPLAVMPTFLADRPGEYLAQLIVNDGLIDSAPDTATVTTANSPPVADAGPDQTVFVTDVVTLDGSGSADVDGDALSFNWSLIALPPGSATSLDDPLAVMPTFNADQPGEYIAQLIVNDGQADSAPDTATVTTANSPPVADAGTDHTVFKGDTVTLDGSGSNDVDGDPLTYRWSFTSVPPGSGAALSDATAVAPQFTADHSGLYVVQLIVNDGQVDSDPATVSITAENRPPVAVAEANPNPGTVGVPVQLDGTASSDPDRDALSYRWSLTAPAGSTATLSDAGAPMPSFVPDVPGAYTAELVVNDGEVDSDPASVAVTVTPANLPPDLLAPGHRTIPEGAAFSTPLFAIDPDNDPMSFSLVSGPAGMNVSPGGTLTWTPALSDLGAHPVTVRVSDGVLTDEESFTVTVIHSLVNLPPPNAPPVLDPIPDQVLTLGETLNINAVASDPEGGPLVFEIFGPAGVTINGATGAISWTPAAEQVGAHDVTVKVTDAAGLADAGQFVVTVRDVNKAPVAEDDHYTARTGETLTVNAPGVLANDNDPNNDPLSAIKVTDPTHGALNFNANGSFDYTPTVPTYRGLYTLDTTAADVNLSLAMPAPNIDATTVSSQRAYQLASSIDDNLNTSWFSVNDGPVILYEQSFVYDITVKAVHIYSSRISGDDFISGRVQLFDVGDVELFDTGVITFPDVTLPPEDRDVVLGIATLAGAPVANVRRVRFSSTEFEDNDPGFAEFHVIGDGTVHVSNITTERQIYGTEESRIRECARDNLAAGDLNADGAADIVCQTNTSSIFNVRMTAFSGRDGSILWDLPAFPYETGIAEMPRLNMVNGAVAALADIDGDGRLEALIAALPGWTPDGTSAGKTTEVLVAFEHDGTLKWVSESIGSPSGNGIANTAPAVADLDGDGDVEIVSGHANNRITIFDHNGSVLVTAEGGGNMNQVSTGPDQMPIVSDIDLDGHPEIIYGDDVYDHTGTLKWSVNQLSGIGTAREAAVANLDDDPQGEVVFVGKSGHIAAHEHDGTQKWRNSTAEIRITGPISVADIDDDGHVEIMGIFGDFLRVLDHSGALKWTRFVATPPNTAQFGEPPTPFDFDGDGVMEVLDQNRVSLRAYDGRDGTLLIQIPTDTGGSSPQAQALVVDVDGDRQAEIALIGSRPGVTSGGVIHVLGPDTGAWPVTRPVWNYPGYHITNIGADGTVPSPEPVNWLTPGLNNFRVNVPMPEERVGRTDGFTYKANDGALDSNEAAVFFDVLPAGAPPQILSQPDTTATVGFPYRYHVLAFDPDVGDVLNYALSSAPAGMTIDPDSGVIAWTPGAADVGDHAIGVTVSDTLGFSDFQAYTLTVSLSVTVPDVVGAARAAAETALTSANLLVGRVTSAHDPDAPIDTVIAQAPPGGSVAEFGSPVDLTVSLGPGLGDTDVDGDGFTPNQGDCDDADGNVFPGALDTPGNGIDENCDGADGTLILTDIILTPAAQTILTGQQVAFAATGVLTNGTSLNLAGLAVWSSTTGAASVNADGVATGLAAGVTAIEATHAGVTGTATLTVVDRVPGDTTAPIADITAPVAHSTITAPTDLIGTADDGNFLKYELAITPASETNFTTIHSSTAPVNNGVLGSFDPTLLINDQYTVRLTVFDSGGNVATDEVVYQVDENMKVGNFTLTFTDLSIPMSGIPITVQRTYDSRDKIQGDFGVGWRLGIQTLRLRTNRPLATGWRMVKSSFFHQLVPDDAHKVSLTLADGRVEEFDMALSRTGAVGPGFDAFARFVPRPGTLGTLALDEDNLVNVIGTGLSGQQIEIQNAGLTGPFAPQRFVYTQIDGTEIVIVRGSGVESVKDTNGNTLTFGPGGITHSAGKSVVFTRDGEGRITSMTDPNGNVTEYAYDTNGDLVSLTDPLGETARFTYGPNHYLLNLIDPQGLTFTRSEYDAAGRLVAVVDAQGNRTEFTHDLDNRREVLTDRRGFITVREYDERGNVVAITDALGNTTTSTFDGRGNKTSETDPLGNTTASTYNDDDLPLSETDPLGQTRSFTYDAFGRVLTATDRKGEVTANTYDGRGNLLTTTGPLGFVTGHAYDARGNRISTTDPLGQITGFSYDGSGNRSGITDPLGTVTSYTYDANGNVLSASTSRTTAAGPQIVTTTYAYDALDRRVATTDALGGIETVEFDAVGNRVAITDPNGNRTNYSYDGLRNLVRTDFAGGTSETYSYDAERNRVTETDRGGRITTFAYDGLGRRVQTTYADGTRPGLTHDAAGRMTSETDANGNTTTHGYDAAGRRIATTDALGNTRSMTYDGRGSQLTSTDENGNTTSFEYDAAGRLIRITAPDGSLALSSYDALGRVLTKADANGNTTSYAYDAIGNLTTVTDALGQITTYNYDELSNRITQTDATGNVTRFEYDALGRMTATVLPLGMSESRTYDSNGNPLSLTDFNGATLDFTYDSDDRLLRRDYPDGSSVVFAYTPTGERASVTASRGLTSYDYDTRDRLVRQTEPDGAAIDYVYDPNGNRLAITTSSGTTRYAYDALNRVRTVTDPAGGLITHAYDAAGNQTSLTYPGGAETVWTYDTRDRVVAVDNRRADTTLISSYLYTLDAVGNRTRVAEADGRTVDYSYDALYRLAGEDIVDPVNGNQSFAYDYSPTGNRLSKTDAAGLTTYTSDANDRLLSEAGPGTAVTYSYDDNGNRLARVAPVGSTLYQFDFDNRLRHVQSNAATIDYGYDADGLRVARGENGTSTNYLWDANREFQQVLEERDGGGPAARYVWDEQFSPLSSETSAGIRYYLNDASRNVRELIDDTSTVTDASDLDGFGGVLQAIQTTPNPYLLHGQHLDDGSELYYVRARWYDPMTGAFLGRDPAAGDPSIPRSLHKHAFTFNNPVMFSDPGGAETLFEFSVQNSLFATTHLIRPPQTQICSQVDPVAKVVDLKGNGWVLRGKEQKLARLLVGDPIYIEDLIFGGPITNDPDDNTSYIVVDFILGGRFIVAKGSNMQVTSERTVVETRLRRGAIWLKIAKQKRPLQVRTTGAILGISDRGRVHGGLPLTPAQCARNAEFREWVNRRRQSPP